MGERTRRPMPDPGREYIKNQGYPTSREIPGNLVKSILSEGNPNIIILFDSCQGPEIYKNKFLGDLPTASQKWQESHRRSHHNPTLNKGQNEQICKWTVRVFVA